MTAPEEPEERSRRLVEGGREKRNCHIVDERIRGPCSGITGVPASVHDALIARGGGLWTSGNAVVESTVAVGPWPNAPTKGSVRGRFDVRGNL